MTNTNDVQALDMLDQEVGMASTAPKAGISDEQLKQLLSTHPEMNPGRPKMESGKVNQGIEF